MFVCCSPTLLYHCLVTAFAPRPSSIIELMVIIPSVLNFKPIHYRDTSQTLPDDITKAQAVLTITVINLVPISIHHCRLSRFNVIRSIITNGSSFW